MTIHRRLRPVLLAILGSCLFWVVAACTANRSPWMSFAEYAESEHPTPYVLRWKLRDSTLLYFGSAHTFDPEDPQVVDIARLWSELRPTLAFNEGGDPPALADPLEAIERHGEAGLVRHLAARDGVPIRSLEPSYEAQVAALRRNFSVEQIVVFYVARQLEQHHRQVTDEHPVEHASRILARLATIPGLTGPGSTGPGSTGPGLTAAPRDLTALAEACSRLLPAPGDCLRPDAAWFDPARFDTGAYTNALTRQLSQQRDEWMVEALRAALQQRGARVFAVVGASHVFMQERALDQALTPARK